MSAERTVAATGVGIDDARLVWRVLAGRRDAYAGLVRRHQARILRLCASLLTDPAAAEDAAQEIFLKAYQSLGAFRGTAAFSTWLYRIAANHCKDLLRKRARERTQSWDALVEEHGEAIEQLLTASDDPRAAVANAELADRVLSHLSPNDRLLLTLREIQGLSYQELARTLGCSVDAVKARLRRARRDLRDKLRHFFGSGHV